MRTWLCILALLLSLSLPALAANYTINDGATQIRPTIDLQVGTLLAKAVSNGAGTLRVQQSDGTTVLSVATDTPRVTVTALTISSLGAGLLTTDGSGNVTAGSANLDDLGDVDTTGVAEGSILKYDNASGTWKVGTDQTGGTGSAAWGSISGTITDQTDLMNYLNAKVPTTRSLTVAGSGGITVTGGAQDLSANRTWTVGIVYGTTANTAAEGNDSRLSDARTPTAHMITSATYHNGWGSSGTFLKSTGTAGAWTNIAWSDVNKAGSSLADLATRALANLSNVSGTAPSDGQILSYVAGTGLWTPVTPDYEPANANIQAHISSTSNPHGVTKAQVGLGNVLNVAQEPALGNPLADGYLLTSTAAGVRSWAAGSAHAAVTVSDSASVDLTLTGQAISAAVLPAGVDHGGLAGLGDDDHPQYHTDARALIWLGTRSTSDLSEGTRLYYTDARARAALSGTSPVTYNTTTGAIGITTGTTAGTVATGNHTHTGTYEPVVATGNAAQFYRGDKTWSNRLVGALQTAAGTSAGGTQHLALMTSSGTNRWAWGLGGTESSGNAGSDLKLFSYDDTGTYLGMPLSITRSTGQVAATYGLTIASLDGVLKGTAGVVSGSATASDLSGWPAAVSMTELSYLDGATNNIQTQLGTKTPTSRTITAGSGLTGGGDLSADRTFAVSWGGSGTAATVAHSDHTHTGTYEPAIAAGTAAQYWRGDKSWQALNATAVGLGNVANAAQVQLQASTPGTTQTGHSNISGTSRAGSIVVTSGTAGTSPTSVYVGSVLTPGEGGSATGIQTTYLTVGSGATNLAAAYGLQIGASSWTKGTTGTITNAYGIYVSAPSIATDNYAIYTTGGTTSLGGTLRLPSLTDGVLRVSSGAVASDAAASHLSGWPAGVSMTELGYLDGVTSAVQTQLDGKVPTSRTLTAGSGLTGGGDLSANRSFAVSWGGTGSAETAARSDHNHDPTTLTNWPAGLDLTELGYVNGVTSAIQTQLDGKSATSHTHAGVYEPVIAAGTSAQFYRGDKSWSNRLGGAILTAAGTSAGGNAHIGLQSTGGAYRWSFVLAGTEAGSNAGSDLKLYSYNDAGSYLGIPLAVTRSTGQVTATYGLTIASLSGVLKGTAGVVSGSAAASDLNGWPAAVSMTEVGYLDGVTSSLQTQIDGKAASSHTHTISDVTMLQTELDGKVPVTRTVTAGTGLSGGGSLGSNISLSVSFGTTAGTVAQGNHTHTGVYEPALGNPAADGYILTSTAAGVRSWVSPSGMSHDPVTVSDTSSIDLSLSGQALSATAKFGTTAGTVAEGNHTHSVGSLSDWPSAVSTTEVGYLDGVTSAIQTQLNAKVPTSRTITAGSGLSGGGDLSNDRTLAINWGGTGNAVTVARSDHYHQESALYNPSGAGPYLEVTAQNEIWSHENIIAPRVTVSGNTSTTALLNVMQSGSAPAIYASGYVNVQSSNVYGLSVSATSGTALVAASDTGDHIKFGGEKMVLDNPGNLFVLGTIRSFNGGFIVGTSAGITTTITIPKLTSGGSNGSLTISGGIITAATNPT